MPMPMNQDKPITRREGVILGSRILAILMLVNAFVGLSTLPEAVYSFRHYADGIASTSGSEYLRHHYLMILGFLITRIIGYSLMASWLFRCGPDIEEWLLPAHMRDESGE